MTVNMDTPKPATPEELELNLWKGRCFQLGFPGSLLADWERDEWDSFEPYDIQKTLEAIVLRYNSFPSLSARVKELEGALEKIREIAILCGTGESPSWVEVYEAARSALSGKGGKS